MAPSVASNHHRVLVVGAGFNGIAAAKIYLEIDPLVDILLIDGESSIGGVWSASRIYPGLQYEMPAPMLDFPDMSMCKELGIEEWSDVDGDQVNDYLVCCSAPKKSDFNSSRAHKY
jgi:dimethylaniline monooxygenase (N-oxide forming)